MILSDYPMVNLNKGLSPCVLLSECSPRWLVQYEVSYVNILRKVPRRNQAESAGRTMCISTPNLGGRGDTWGFPGYFGRAGTGTA